MSPPNSYRVERQPAAFALIALLFALSATLQAGPPDGIVLYSNSDWTGDRLVVNEQAISNLGEYGWNDSTGSFEIFAGTWVLYDDDGYWANRPSETTLPLGPGRHTGLSFGVSSLRRMPESGITLFNESHLRGYSRTFLTSRKFDGSVKGGLNNDFNSAWIPPNEANQWTLYDGLFSGFSDYFPRLQTGAINQIPSTVSSVFREGFQDRGLTEVEYPITDNALLRPRNPVAADSLSNSGPGIATHMQIRLNGFFGVDHTTCAGKDFYHPQHVVRLKNKDGRAYFMVAHSASSADLDRAAGSIAIFRMDEDALDPTTDLVIDTPGTDGEYVWSQEFNDSVPYGDWNHPGKMAVLGDVLVVAGEQWGSHWCDARDGDEDDAVIFYDLRDPENPRFWGKIEAFELGVNIQEGQLGGGLGDAFGAGDGGNVQRYFGKDVSRRAISKLSLDYVNGQYLLSVGNNNDDKQRIFRARQGVVLPYASAWELAGIGGLTGAHGFNFLSREENGTGRDPGRERLMFFDGEEDPDRMSFWDVQFTPEGSTTPSLDPAASGMFAVRRDRVYSRNFPGNALLHKVADTASAYVNEASRPVVYGVDSRDPYNARAEDFEYDTGIDGTVGDLINGLRGNQSTGLSGWFANLGLDFSFQPSYYNSYIQIHVDEPDNVVDEVTTRLADVVMGSTGEVITFAPSLDGQTITLTTPLSVNKRLVIDASNLPNGVTIDGAGSAAFDQDALVTVGTNGDLYLVNINLTGSSGNGSGSPAVIENSGILNLLDVSISNNPTRALLNFGSAHLRNTSIANNVDAGGSGVLQVDLLAVPGTPQLVLRNVTFSDNVATGNTLGGAIQSLGGVVDAANCTIGGSNLAAIGNGGGIYFSGAGQDPSSQAVLRLTHCTVFNEVTVVDAVAGQVELRNNIIERLNGDAFGLTPNIVTVHFGNNAGPEPLIVAANLGLGPLADNGGTTLTILPQMGSPAIDRGVFLSEFDTDQRGEERIYPDLGAAETPDLNLRALGVSGTRLTPDLDVSNTEYAASTSFRNAPWLRADELDEDGKPDRLIDYRVNGGLLYRIADPALGLARPGLDLNVGMNTVEIIVRDLAETTSKTYTIMVNREPPDGNANLQWLSTSIGSLLPDFNAPTTAYDAGTTSRRALRIWAQPQVSHAVVELRVNGEEFIAIPGPATLSAGRNHNLVVDGNNSTRGWGSNLRLTDREFVGQSQPPAVDLDNARAVSAGGSHSLQLSLDGQVQAWGSNDFGQTSVPLLEGVLEVAAGLNHSLAVQSINGGTVVAWGDNSSGQTDVPAGLSGVVRVAAGNAHSVALRSDGTVVVWGDNSEGQLVIPNVLAFGVKKAVAIAAGFDFTLALLDDGTVERWGSVLSNGLTNVPSTLAKVVDIGAGGDGTQDVNLALQGNGKVVGWGALADCEIEGVVDGVVDLAAGGRHRAAVLDDGRVFAWGNNSLQQSLVPAGLSIATPGSAAISLKPGINNIDVRVIAEDGTEKVYSITVNQDDTAVADQFEMAPNSLSAVREGTKQPFENPNLIGLTVNYRVTGATNGFIAGGLMGTPYTLDTGIATAAVHAGVLQDGETGLVSLRIAATPPTDDFGGDNFLGGVQNDIDSRSIRSGDPQTAFEIRPYAGDPTAILREQYDVEPGIPPTDFRCYGSREGETLIFLAYGATVTDPNNPPSAQVIWYQKSNNRYSADSPLAVTAVHAGILKPGALGLVAVTFGEGFSFVSNDLSADTQLQNGVRPAQRGDNHSSRVNGSYTMTAVLAFEPDDADGDGIDDLTEALEATDPLNPDSDLDGLPDGWEIENRTDPLVRDADQDPDMDGLTNREEFERGTLAWNPDSDGDGMPDGWEVMNNLNPNVDDAAGNPDNDENDNLAEFRANTDPRQFDAASTLTLTVTVTGAGSVTSLPAGIDCPNVSCSASFDRDADVELSQTAGGEGTFIGWGQDCEGAAVCVLVMTTNRQVSAEFQGADLIFKSRFEREEEVLGRQ